MVLRLAASAAWGQILNTHVPVSVTVLIVGESLRCISHSARQDACWCGGQLHTECWTTDTGASLKTTAVRMCEAVGLKRNESPSRIRIHKNYITMAKPSDYGVVSNIPRSLTCVLLEEAGQNLKRLTSSS